MQSAFSLQLSPAQPSGELRFTDKDFCMHCHLETEKERPERDKGEEGEREQEKITRKFKY